MQTIWYLSFADTTRPAGTQWLGGCYVMAHDLESAASRAWEVGANPGGQVLAVKAPTSVTVRAGYMDRLLNVNEVAVAVGDDPKDNRTSGELMDSGQMAGGCGGGEVTYLNWFAEHWILGLVCFFSILYF